MAIQHFIRETYNTFGALPATGVSNILYELNNGDLYRWNSITSGYTSWSTVGSGETLSQVLTNGNTTGANDIILTDGQDITSSVGGGQLTLNDSFGPDGTWSITSDNRAYGSGSTWVYGQPGNGSQLSYQKDASEAIGFGVYSSGVTEPLMANAKEVVIIDNTAGNKSSGSIDKRAVFVGTRNSTINAGVTNSVVVGGVGVTASQDDTLYTQNARLAENGGVIYSAGTDLYDIFAPAIGGGYVSGSGTDNTIPLWNGTTGLDDSIMTQQASSAVTVSGNLEVNNTSSDQSTRLKIDSAIGNGGIDDIGLHIVGTVDNSTSRRLLKINQTNPFQGTPKQNPTLLEILGGSNNSTDGTEVIGLGVSQHPYVSVGTDIVNHTQLNVSHVARLDTGFFTNTKSANFANECEGSVNNGTTYYKYGVDIESTGAWANAGVGNCINIGLDVLVSGGDINYPALFNGGNVGIGTTAPIERLDVGSGNIYTNGNITGDTVHADAFFSMTPYTDGSPASPSDNDVWFNSGATGTITLNYRIGGNNFSVELAP